MELDSSPDQFSQPRVIPAIDDEYVRDGLEQAARQAEEGNDADWDVDEIKASARKLLAERQREH